LLPCAAHDDRPAELLSGVERMAAGALAVNTTDGQALIGAALLKQSD
jgi:hypothetical protein